MNSILLSIKPYYSDAIYSGSKSIELRRKIGHGFSIGKKIYFYSSSPQKMITGEACIFNIHKGPPSEIKTLALEKSFISSEDYEKYFCNSENAYGIELHRIKKYTDTISIETLRAKGISPPQSFRYLTPEAEQAIRK